jgi:hypothetical protein
MAKRNSLAWALLAAIGACSESKQDQALPKETNLNDDVIPISVKAPACPGSQAILPISRECDTGLPVLYSGMDETAPLALAKCVWKTFEARLSEDEALRFRLQNCANEAEESPLKQIAISAKNRALSIHVGEGAHAKRSEFLQTYELDGVDGMAFLEARRASLPAWERDRCVVRPYQSADFTRPNKWDNLYEIAPSPAYAAEIEARGAPASACGEQGWSKDGGRYWELRAGEAWFWDTGEEAPLYDPRSFTILHQRGEGSWSLAEMPAVGLAN